MSESLNFGNNIIKKITKGLKPAVVAVVTAFNTGSATEVGVDNPQNQDVITSSSTNIQEKSVEQEPLQKEETNLDAEPRNLSHINENSYFTEEKFGQYAKDLILKDGRRYRFVYSDLNNEKVTQCIKPNSVSSDDVMKSLLLINYNYKGRLSRANIESIAQRLQRDLSMLEILKKIGKGDSSEAQFLINNIYREFEEHPGAFLPRSI